MDAVYVYLITSSWVFLLGWVVLLLVAYALAFRGDSAEAMPTWGQPLSAVQRSKAPQGSGQSAGCP